MSLAAIEVFEYRADAALQAYPRHAVMNRIRNEIRRATRHSAPETLDSAAPDAGLSPLEELIGKQTVEAYDEAMAQLGPGEREAIVGRKEAGENRVFVATANMAFWFDNPLNRWMRGRAQLARLYRQNGQPREAEAIEAHLLKLLAVADPDDPLLLELRARAAGTPNRP